MQVFAGMGSSSKVKVIKGRISVLLDHFSTP